MKELEYHVTYEQAILLKECGFSQEIKPGDGVFYTAANNDGALISYNTYNQDRNNDVIAAPSISLVQDWIKSKYKIELRVYKNEFGCYSAYSPQLKSFDFSPFGFCSYIQALNAGITKILKYIKTNNYES